MLGSLRARVSLLALASAVTLAAACTADDPEIGAPTGDGSGDQADASTGTPDAGSQDGQDAAAPVDGGDAGDAPKVCTPTMPFLTVTPLGGAAIASTVLEESPRLSKDELRLTFTRRSFPGDTNGSTYVATRPTRGAEFTNPTPLPELVVTGNSNGGALGAAPTADGLRVVFSSRRSSPYNDDLFLATRANAGIAFGTPAVLDLVSAANVDDFTPFLVGDDLWFASTRAGVGQEDLYVAGWNGTTYASASAVAGINTGSREYAPVLNDAETVMYFASDRGGTDAVGQADIFAATRPTSTDAWGAPVRLPSASSAGNDAPGWISDDGCRLYLWADRVGNDVNLWVAER